MYLDPYERWLLEMVVELRYPLVLLGAAELDVHLNRPGHGLPSKEIALRVHRSLDAGMLELIEIRGSARRVVGMTAAELVIHLAAQASSNGNLGDGVYFGLTGAGGAAWEAFARPDWSRYVVDETGDEVMICARHRDRVEAYLQGTSGDERPSRAAEAWKLRAPWQATYWKVLPTGVCCRFPSALDVRREMTREYDEWLREFCRWFDPVLLP